MAHSRIWSDAKVDLVAEAVGEPTVHIVGHLVALWHTAYEHYLPSGQIPESHVEPAAKWDGEKGALLAALCAHNLIDKRRKKYYLHNFLKNAPEYVRKRVTRLGLTKPVVSGECPGSVRTTADNGDSIQPNPTEGKKRENGTLVSWSGTAFVVPDSVMTEFENRWPNVTREAIDQEILDCAAYHAERKTKIKSPKGRIVTWLKNAFDKFQQREAAVPKRRQGQNVKVVLGLENAKPTTSP